MNLVMIPFHDWRKCEREGFRTRDAHFMQEFSRHEHVKKLLVVNRPISFAEILVYRRRWRVQDGNTVYQRRFEYLTEVGPGTYTLDIVVPEFIQPILKKRAWIPYIFERHMVRQALTRALEHLEMFDDLAFLMSAPLFVPMIPYFLDHVWVLDAQDNLLKHANYHDLPGLERYYHECQRYVDIITTNSEENARWLSKGHPNVVVLTNGVDTSMFDPEVRRSVPHDMSGLSSPIVGYAGKMQSLFDVQLMKYVVSSLPEVQFVFIGQILDQEFMSPLWEHPNVHYLGDKPYASLPDYLSAFDICIIPYDKERQHGGDPIKFYEYLSMNKSVVTTDIGNVSAFCDDPRVSVVSGKTEFTDSIRRFTQDLDQDLLQFPGDLPVEHHWHSKADRLATMMLDRILERG